MSELSNKIKALRGTMKGEEAGAKAGLSRESIYRIERGAPVKLSTLRQIAKAFNATEEQWLDILIAWIKFECGPDAGKLWLEPKEVKSSQLHEAEDNQISRAMTLFQQLNSADRSQIMRAMARPEVRACLPAINRVWEKLSAPKVPLPAGIKLPPANSPTVAAAEQEIADAIEAEVENLKKSHPKPEK